MITSNSSLEDEKVSTEKVRKLQLKVVELENSNKSLRQNLLDTIGDLKSTEKENEVIFGDKLKLLKQLGENLEEPAQPLLAKDEENNNFAKYDEPSEDAVEKGDIQPEKEIGLKNEFFNENNNLIDRSENVINKYNSLIQENLEKSQQLLSENSQSFIKQK